MKTPPLNLSAFFNDTLIELYAAEKKYLKCFSTMVDTALTDELSKALSPEHTEIENHIFRITQIMDLQKLKISRITSTFDDELLKMGKEVCGFIKQKSVIKDIQLLQCTQLITQSKAVRYETLHQLAKELKMEQAVLLFEQSAKDNNNTCAYLTQIAQNIIYPTANKLESSSKGV